MAYSKEIKQAKQEVYKEARSFGHTKEEARTIRDSYKTTKISKGLSNGDDVDGDDWSWSNSEPYSQDCIDD